MVDLKLPKFVELYNKFTELELPFLDIMDLLEEMLPVVQDFSEISQLTHSEFIVDDTTAKMSRDLQDACAILVPHIEKIVGDYSGISNDEVKIFIDGLPKIIMSLSLIAYSAYGFDKVIEERMQSDVIDLTGGSFSNQVFEIASVSMSDVYTIASIICSALHTFKPYLPEYMLSDEEISDLQDAIFSSNLPSDSLATLSPEFISRVLGGD